MERFLVCGLLVLLLGACKGTDSEVTISYEGQGRILGEGIDCGNECETSLYNSWFNSQKNISYKSTLIAEPEPGYEFFAWHGVSGDHFNTPCGTDTQCNITVRSRCNDLLDFRPALFSCSELEGNRISQHGIFVAGGSILTSAAYRDRNRCLITLDGQLKCWGIGGTDTPTVNLPYAVKVSNSSACVAGNDGLSCWGSEPVANNIPVISDLVDFDVSNDTACAIDGDQVLCWGDTDFLQPMPAFSSPDAISLDEPMACVQDQSELKCWGPLAAGQSKPPSLTAPTTIAVFDDITGPGFSCALDGNELQCWGEDQAYTSRVSGLINPSELTLNDQFLCYRDTASAVSVRCVDNAVDGGAFLMPYSLQDNGNLQLGESGYLCSTDLDGVECWNARLPDSAPTRPISMAQPDDIDVDGSGGCALKGDQLQCWDIAVADDVPSRVSLSQPNVVATNGMVACAGGLGGVRCFTSVQTPSQIVELQPADLTDVTDLAMSSFYACAIHNSQVTCWGDDDMGVLEVPPLSNPTQLALGRYHACALDNSGVVCWGEKVAIGR